MTDITEVPKDIRETAFNIANVFAPDDVTFNDMAASISQALLTERNTTLERAAKVAEEFGKPYAVNTATAAVVFRSNVGKIAAAIRREIK